MVDKDDSEHGVINAGPALSSIFNHFRQGHAT